MYEDKKAYLKTYPLQNRKIYRLTKMIESDPAGIRRYEEEIRKSERIKAEIEDKIEATDGGILSELLYLKYVCGKTLEEIAPILHYSERHTERLHRKALKLFPL